MFQKKRTASWVSATVVACSIGCSNHAKDAAAGAGAKEKAPQEVPASVHYPAGRWRLAPPDDLARSIVWVSHILVMHKGSRPALSGLRQGEWAPDTVPERSREDAYRIAVTAQAEARSNPAAFGKLALEYSDDIVTREHGGSLGGVHVVELAPAFTDAISALQPGQVSDVFETAMGFHIVLLGHAPPQGMVAGARIVVRYQSTRGSSVERTRTEALERARALATRARSGEDFEALARNESDDPDRTRGGAMGVWSTREPRADNALALEALSSLPEGGVSDAVDSPVGLQIVKRIESRAPVEFAMRAVRIPTSAPMPASGGDATPAPPDPSRTEAERVARVLRKNPDAFSKVVEGRCCRSPERWLDGHGDPVLTSAMETLAIGEVAAAPIRVGAFYIVAQRIDPSSTCPPPRPIWGLPSPASIDLEEIVRANDGAKLASEMRTLAPVVASLGLPQAEESTFTGALEQFRDALSSANTAEARLDAYRKSLDKIHSSLPEATYARLVSLIESWASARALGLAMQ